MSVESAIAFKGLVEQDAALQAEALAAHGSGGLPVVCNLAAGKGFAFTPADAEAALATTGEELSDLELAAVAGGAGKTRGGAHFVGLRPRFVLDLSKR